MISPHAPNGALLLVGIVLLNGYGASCLPACPTRDAMASSVLGGF